MWEPGRRRLQVSATVMRAVRGNQGTTHGWDVTITAGRSRAARVAERPNVQEKAGGRTLHDRLQGTRAVRPRSESPTTTLKLPHGSALPTASCAFCGSRRRPRRPCAAGSVVDEQQARKRALGNGNPGVPKYSGAARSEAAGAGGSAAGRNEV